MRDILSQLPVMVFLTVVVLIYYYECRIWVMFFFHKFRKRDSQKILYKPASIVIHLLSLTGIFCAAYGYFIEPYRVEVNTIPIYTDKLKNASFRIVLISDLHCVKTMRAEKTVIGRIQEIKPDVIVFTGDTLSHRDGLELFHDTMATLDAPLGKFAVTGNWDENFWHTLNLFDVTGFKRLSHDAVEVTKNGDSIRIAGLDFSQDIASLPDLKNSNANLYTIFLYHNTDMVDYYDSLPIDLYLCGHTHGGQVSLPLYGAITTLSKHGKKYEAGMYNLGHYQLYVSRGIGMEGGLAPPIRFCAQPEITVFELQPIAK